MNKKIIVLSIAMIFIFAITVVLFFADESSLLDLVLADKPIYKSNSKLCATIQDGTLSGADGTELILGYNEWSYNYQAHMFNGVWCDYHPVYRPGGSSYFWCLENMADVELMMKWSDEWLSNKDCNYDGKLDRGYSCNPIIANSSACLGAWLTNHERGTYLNEDGETCKYNYFVKIIAVPTSAQVIGDVWYTLEGVEIGPAIWGGYAIIQEVHNDPCGDRHGLIYMSPERVGLGYWK